MLIWDSSHVRRRVDTSYFVPNARLWRWGWRAIIVALIGGILLWLSA